MLIKSADDKDTAIKTLEAILRIPGLPQSKRELVVQEIRTTKAGIKGESDTAYLIDFHLKDSKNTMVLHDLRFELADGRTAQIDHVLIHRTGRMWVLESKRVAHGVKITEEGDFLRWTGRNYDGMASPLEQNKRHVEAMKAVVKSINSGFEIKAYLAYVLVSSKARVDRPKKFDTSLVVKADRFLAAFEKDLDKIGVLGVLAAMGTIFSDAHEKFARLLASLHKPIEFDYAKRFGVSKEALEATMISQHLQANAIPQTESPIASGAASPFQAVAPVAAVQPMSVPSSAVAPEEAVEASAANVVSWDEYDIDPDWLEHIGLTGPTPSAKLPVLPDVDSPNTLVAAAEHEPERRASTRTEESAGIVAAEQQSETVHRCRTCDATNLFVAHGKFGYYFKCRSCSGNTPIRLSCGHASHQERIRKEGAKFFRECRDCGSSSLFFENI